VSGDVAAAVNLVGTSMSAVAAAIPIVAARTGRDVIVVGGLAVVCRLGRPYRATTDLDIVSRHTVDEPAQLQLLVASGAAVSGPSGVLIGTPDGPVQVDVLSVSDAELDSLPADPTDRLHVLAHAWAAATANSVVIRVAGARELVAAVAQPGPLIATKLQSIMNRGSAKEATDLLDIVALTLDEHSGPAAREQLRAADPVLRADAALHTERWFGAGAERSLRRVRAIPEGRDLDADTMRLVGELLLGSL
jgi:hypothetical protein